MTAPGTTRTTPDRIDSALGACVHCGFCLPACPTYLATADEADSPRGRIVLMRALARGELDANDPSLNEHLDACLGCRGCEPVCPSGVAYGHGLEAARALIAARRGIGWKARAILTVFRHRVLWRPLLRIARYVRDLGLARRLAGASSLGFSFGMLASTAPSRSPVRAGARISAPDRTAAAAALFRGCVMDELFGHVHESTAAALRQQGYRIAEVKKQVCCGALHVHAGDEASARALARRNVAAFRNHDGPIVVNSAGCGAMLKDYAYLLPGDADAAHVAERVRDVSELLQPHGASAVTTSPLTPPMLAVYDAPCHLQHAQRIQDAPLAMLSTVPGLTVLVPPTSSQCCGSAGIYSMLEPTMSREVLAAKIAEIAALRPRPDVVLTGNPGCLMQIGAGLRAAGIEIPVRHPVELLGAGQR